MRISFSHSVLFFKKIKYNSKFQNLIIAHALVKFGDAHEKIGIAQMEYSDRLSDEYESRLANNMDDLKAYAV